MKPRSVHRPGRRHWPWRGMVVLWIAATLITIGVPGSVAAATCTGATFAGNTFTVQENFDGRGNGTASVSGCDGDLTSVSVTLIFTSNSLPFERDLDLLLVHPNGINNLIIFSEVGNFASFTGTFTLADSGATCPPQETGSGTGALVSGTTYKPVDYAGFSDDFGPGTPATQFSAGQSCPGASGTQSFASAFAGLSANGTWTLYAYDDIAEIIPDYTVSWSLTITTSTTEAQVESFTATPVIGEGAQLRWQTGREVDNLGFNVYREQDGQRTKLNHSPIAGSALLAGPGTALTAGRSYVWWDALELGTGAARYWLEDMDLNGRSTWHGPAAAGESARPGLPPLADQAKSQLLSSLRGLAVQAPATKPVERRVSPATLSHALSGRLAHLAAHPAVKLSVRQEGWYRVTAAELLAAGLPPNVNPRFLHLYVDGQEVPVLVTGQEDGRLDPGDALEFYGLGLDAAWTDTRVYWLAVQGWPGRRISPALTLGGQPADPSFPYTIERKDRTVYFSALRNGERENFFGAVVGPEPSAESLQLSHLDPAPSGTTLLEVALQGVTQGSHRVQVTLNGVGVGEVIFEGQSAGVNNFPLTPSWLRQGTNEVELIALGGERDFSLIDTLRLTYWRTHTADNDELRFSATGRQRLTIAGFSSAAIRVFDITDANTVREVPGTVKAQDSGFAVTLNVPGSGQRALLALTTAQAKAVAGIASNQPSGWYQPGHGADLVIISHHDFLASLGPLMAQRQSQGLSVVLIDVVDLYDELSFGHKTPYAVRDFLSYAATQWQPAPRFVLLVGDASWDPKNYLGHGDYDLLPTKLIDTQLMETASDDWLADFDQDGLAEMAVGRLPGKTVEEIDRLVAKIVGYDQAGAGGWVLLVADLDDGIAFGATNAALWELIRPGVSVEAIDRGLVDSDTAKSQLIASVNRGPTLVNYIGHGSLNLWRGNLLTADDAAALSNDERLSVFVTMTCLNGYFHDAALDSLAEALLHAVGGGAVAVWAPSGMTGSSSQAAMNQELFRWLFVESTSTGGPLSLGEAVRRAKAGVSDHDVQRTWILLGDPTMPVEFP